MHTHIHTYTYAYAYACMYMYMRTCMCIYVCTQVAPFAEGGLDVRSRAFVQLSVACEAAWAAAARDKPGGASAGLGACDGVQGYLLAQCIGNSSVDLFHLTWLQFAHSPTAHAVVLHSQKSRRQRMA